VIVEAAVSVESLWVGFRRKNRRGWRRRGDLHWVLRDLDFAVAPGETFGVIGGNGSGKSVLLFTLSGVYSPSQGRVWAQGRVASLIELSVGFHRELTGRENVMVAGVLSGMSRAEVDRRYDEIVDFSGIPPDVMDTPLLTFSAGMGLRMAFSVIVHSDPAVVLVDEVLAVGDEAFQARCLKRLSNMRRDGCAIVFVSHDLDLVVRECDRVGVLESGRFAFVGAPEPAVAAFRAIAGEQVQSEQSLFGRRQRRQRRRWA
jgi:ABC-type polysaccharide/polyol phosphate transport system ATPase subunit